MQEQSKIYQMDHNGEWVVVDWKSGQVEELEKDKEECQKKKDS